MLYEDLIMGAAGERRKKFGGLGSPDERPADTGMALPPVRASVSDRIYTYDLV
jgi:hypothetical protein